MTAAPWLANAGECLLIDSGPSGKHLFVVVLVATLPSGERQVVSCPVCSIGNLPRYDTACLIEAGEHPFVGHPSFIEYRHARLDDVGHVERMVKDLTFIPQPIASAELLSKAQAGLKQSMFVKRHFKDLISKYL